MRLYRFIRWLLAAATRVFFRRIEVAGLGNVPRDGEGAAIFCGNHPNSLLDPVLITAYCGRIVHFAAKDVLFESRLLRIFLDALGAVPVKRRSDHAGGAVDNEAMFEALHSVLGAGRSVLVQPYLASVEEVGETGLVYLADRFSHGFRKEPLLVDRAAPVDQPRDAPISPRTPSGAEREVAEAALDAVGAMVAGAGREGLLYARVDLVRGPDGPVLMELELIEPSLYLHVDPSAPARAASAIIEHSRVG